MTFDAPYPVRDRAPDRHPHPEQVIHTETNVAAVQDPLGGSWYLELLTDELSAASTPRCGRWRLSVTWAPWPRTVTSGASSCAAWTGTLPRSRAGTCASWASTSTSSPPKTTWSLRDLAEQRFEPDENAQVERIRAWRPTRDDAPLQAGLERVREASADPDADLMGPIVAALDADATIGEITGSLREGVGRPGDPFEFAAARLDGTRA